MGRDRHSMKGFTLIASLLLLLLLSGISIGLMFMISGSGHISGNDLETTQAYYEAQSGIEQLTVNLATVYQGKLSPQQTDLDSMATSSQASATSLFPGTTFLEKATWTNPKGDGTGLGTSNVISQGNDAGLTAELVPVTVQVTAIRPSGAAVSMTRGVEAAIIPVFQFGVFSQSDLSYFAGPEFNFNGRVHTNGNLFLAANSGPLIFGSKVTAVGQIIRDQLANGFTGGTSSYYGNVFVPNQTGGCDTYIANNGASGLGSNCINVGKDTGNGTNDASWSGGYPTGGSANSNWTTLSKGTFNSMLGNQTSIGVQPLELPFVQSNVSGQQADPIEIIRKPELTTEAVTSPLGASREINKANIRILFGDTEAELHPTGSANDGEDIQLEVEKSEKLTNGGATAYFAVADNSTSGPVTTGGDGSTTSKAIVKTTTIVDPYWNSLNALTPFLPPCGNSIPPNCTAYPAGTTQWPLVRGWLRVEYLGKDGTWHGVTHEWLKYGFAKDPAIQRTSPGADTVGHKDAILILQQIADRDGDGAIANKAIQLSSAGPVKVSGKYTTTVTQTIESTASTGTNTNFYPINLYDAREGFPRDASPLTGTQGYANGIMSAAELDVGNLAKWIAGTGDYAGSSGSSVDNSPEAGYLVYFSDRRGMEPNPNATDGSENPLPNVTNGESGLEDVINSSSALGTPDQKLEAKSSAYTPPQSPEDVDDNGLLDNWGYKDIGYGFGLVFATANPYQVVDCMNGGRQNWVSGARRVLKLVDGSLGNLPTPGFTVTSENPVYVQGDYNSDAADTVWKSTTTPPFQDDPRGHSAASVIADAVTMLSNNWTDIISMSNPSNLGGRNRTQTYYRMAIAAGKNMNFPRSSVAGTPPNDFGTDGGLHNFLRLLEQGGDNINYRGSLVSLFYSEYATGAFKCCTLVYGAPGRNFSFDVDFLTPANLPPGTPELQDIVNLSYWQSFTPCTTQTNGNCTN